MNGKIKVLYLLNHAGGGGSERYIQSLVGSLSERIEPVFVYNEPGKLSDTLRSRGVVCRQLKMKSPFDFGAARELSKICRELQIDLIHTHFMRENAIAVWAKWFCNVRVVNTVHMQTPKSGLALRLNRFISRYCANIAVSRAVLNNLKRECKGVTRMIYNGVALPESKTTDDLPEERLRVLSLGRFSAEKGMSFLVKAAAHLPDLDFTIAGDGETLKQCRAIAADNVTFPGYVNDTSALYRSADIYVCPSLEEALGLSVLEAMSYGIPAVVTNAGGLPEIVDDTCGVIVQPSDENELASAIRRLAENPELRKTLGANARKRIEDKFSLQAMSEQTFELYTEVLQ
jgi:glycosyltransferase involved in cell wall biosynthesis